MLQKYNNLIYQKMLQEKERKKKLKNQIKPISDEPMIEMASLNDHESQDLQRPAEKEPAKE